MRGGSDEAMSSPSRVNSMLCPTASSSELREAPELHSASVVGMTMTVVMPSMSSSRPTTSLPSSTPVTAPEWRAPSLCKHESSSDAVAASNTQVPRARSSLIVGFFHSRTWLLFSFDERVPHIGGRFCSHEGRPSSALELGRIRALPRMTPSGHQRHQPVLLAADALLE